MGLVSIEVTDAKTSSLTLPTFSPRRPGSPYGKRKVNKSSDFSISYFCKIGIFFLKLLTIKGTSFGAGAVFIFRIHSLARLSVQSQPLLSHPLEFGSSPQGAS